MFSSRITGVVASALVVPIALLLFASGFFPYKPFLPGSNVFNEENNVSRPPPIFDRVVFIVIDALRSDFVYSDHSGFQFTQGLIRSGAAIPFTAHASSPTVTMPRVKAITTGSVPSFADVILNLAESESMSTLAQQDTWLSQLKAQPNGRLVMYGDDTWLNLFPGMFDRHDGTSSFFVSDFTEVDNNVTRHVPEELLMPDWSAMIMHYLGLDHIGHKAGPNSQHMIPKQREMDGIVQEIFTAMETHEHLNSALFVLCGDHGMNDAGNHGGASAGEISPALTFISPKFWGQQKKRSCPESPFEEFQYYQTIEQSDIAPTLAGLLGFPVPLNNLGVFIPEFLPLWKQGADRMQLLLENARQILLVVKETFSGHEFPEDLSTKFCEKEARTDAHNLQCLWQQAMQLVSKARTDPTYSTQAESSLLAFCRASQEVMSNAASNYDLTRLYYGALAAGLAVTLSVISWFQVPVKSTGATAYFVALSIGYGVLMFASSYVEEEQQFWYWILTGWQFYLYVRSYKSNERIVRAIPFLLAASSRIARRWNQTGQKFAAEPDIAGEFLSEHTNVLWALILFTYTNIYQCLRPPDEPDWQSRLLGLLYLPLTSFAFVFKLSFTAADSPELIRGAYLLPTLVEAVSGLSLVIQARVIFLGTGVACLAIVYQRLRASPVGRRKDLASSFHNVLSLFLITQSPSRNVPLFAIFRLQQQLIKFMGLSDTEITITSLLFQYTSFFILGGSNSIASVDLSNAYNGVSSYNIVMVGFLTFVNNWAGPIWWVSATYSLFYSKRRGTSGAIRSHIPILTFFVSTSVLAVMVACTVLRSHLFIWTVFSPKYLYSAAWALGQHVLVNLIWGDCLLRWLYN